VLGQFQNLKMVGKYNCVVLWYNTQKTIRLLLFESELSIFIPWALAKSVFEICSTNSLAVKTSSTIEIQGLINFKLKHIVLSIWPDGRRFIPLIDLTQVKEARNSSIHREQTVIAGRIIALETKQNLIDQNCGYSGPRLVGSL
jgi:hypothetical protein